MSDQSETPWALLAAYLAGQCTPDEQRAVERWMADDAEHTAMVAELRAAVGMVRPAALPPLDLAAMQAAVVQTATQRDGTSSVRRSVSLPETTNAGASRDTTSFTTAERDGRMLHPTRRMPSVWQRVAVMAGVAAAAAVAVVTVWRQPPTSASAAPGHRYVTGPGQQETITLADGTRIVLAPQSRLTLAAGFGTSNRDVSLAGQAYFDVTHAATAPFVVRTGAIRTTVLGTAFDIAARPGTRGVRVAVVSGKVMSGARAPITLAAGDVADVTDSSATPVAGANAAESAAWTNGRLHFHNTPVTEVLATLSQWYGIDFRLADSSMRHQDVTGAFDARSQADALTALKVVLDASLTFERANDHLVVTIHPWNESATPKRIKVREPLTHALTEVGR